MTAQHTRTLATKGSVLHATARYYDVLAWLMTGGHDRAFRERLVDLARIEPGQTVLDIGCGTGSLALAAKRRVGADGAVYGIDASSEMIGRARRKARRAGLEVVFQEAVVEVLPFPDARFDVALSTLMLHHLPRPARQQCVREVRRVLRPTGRLLAVDFATPPRKQRGLLSQIHRHGFVEPGDVERLLTDSGLRVVAKGPVGVRDLHFVLAAVTSDV